MSVKTFPAPLAMRAIDMPALIMIGAAANALVVTVMKDLAAGDGLSLTFGISPFMIVAIFVAARLSLAGDHQPGPLRPWLDIPVLALILVPSSAVSWAALALYAGLEAASTTAERRIGALFFLAVALASLWSSVILKWIALPVTTAEAFVLAKTLLPLRPDIVQVANVVGNPQTHSLILMTRCTTVDALPHAAVALMAVAHLLGDARQSRIWQALATLAVIYALANLVRLGAMAWSAESYALVHGPIGTNLFDLFQALLVLTLGNWVSEP